jgi:hypothetical protein
MKIDQQPSLLSGKDDVITIGREDSKITRYFSLMSNCLNESNEMVCGNLMLQSTLCIDPPRLLSSSYRRRLSETRTHSLAFHMAVEPESKIPIKEGTHRPLFNTLKTDHFQWHSLTCHFWKVLNCSITFMTLIHGKLSLRNTYWLSLSSNEHFLYLVHWIMATAPKIVWMNAVR